MSRNEMIKKLFDYAEIIDPWNMSEYADSYYSMTEEELEEQIRQAEKWLAEYEMEVA